MLNQINWLRILIKRMGVTVMCSSLADVWGEGKLSLSLDVYSNHDAILNGDGMAEIVGDCPRCNVKRVTFHVASSVRIDNVAGRRNTHEAFCICKQCGTSTVFIMAIKENMFGQIHSSSFPHNLKDSIDSSFEILSIVSVLGHSPTFPPEFLPSDIHNAFVEGSQCLMIGCYNAAAAMYRLCLDKTSAALLPVESDNPDGLNSKIRRSLGLRLEWLFNTKRLPESLKELSQCVKDDGNDGAHEGTLQLVDAQDLEEFTYILLERIYTEPERLRLASARRAERHRAN